MKQRGCWWSRCEIEWLIKERKTSHLNFEQFWFFCLKNMSKYNAKEIKIWYTIYVLCSGTWWFCCVLLSHPAWGAWIEMDTIIELKSHYRSHPAWGAWIEIGCWNFKRVLWICRTPHGVRGLKSLNDGACHISPCRTPHGVRGLTLFARQCCSAAHLSHPAWGAWIEMTSAVERKNGGRRGRTPHGVRGLKSVRYRLWRIPSKVAPRMGCVDWNTGGFHTVGKPRGRTPHGVRGLKSYLILS